MSKILAFTALLSAAVLIPLLARPPVLKAANDALPPAQPAQAAAGPTRQYFGVLACSNGGCHNSPIKDADNIKLCDFNEVEIWTRHDKHQSANRVLKGERGQQMARLLGIEGDLAAEPSCISCHGVLIKDAKLKHSSFDLAEGVSCVACHGPYREWVGKHSEFLERENWRALSRKQKEEQYGMADLWDPHKRAVLCASCHVGNSAEGKVVTHAMYAAGHPPLPGFEVATFSDAMPRHWKYLSEKKPDVQKMMKYDPSHLEQMELVVVGGVATFRESLNLIATQAAQAEKSWPELAQFDCYACHHDLKRKSWRQERGYSGRPGRPEMRPWSAALIEAGIFQASRGDAEQRRQLTESYQVHMKELAAEYHAQPFGDAAKVSRAAVRLSDWSDKLLRKLTSARFDRPAAGQVIGMLGQQAVGRSVDFDTARQLTWAFRSIQNELDPGFFKNERHAEAFGKLESQLKLHLPIGQTEIVKDYLPSVLKRLGDYEPERFRECWEVLRQRTK